MTGQDTTLLLVEDDPLISELLSLHLESEGFAVVPAEHGQQALELLEQPDSHIDAIISDVNMPEMDGYEFCSRVRELERYQDAPFLFVSGQTSLEEKMRGYEVGGDDYITKPVVPTEVVLKIRNIISEKQRCAALNKQVQDTQKAAMQAMTYAGNLGQVLQLMQNSLDCKTFAELARQFLDVTEGYGLACAIQFRTPQGAETYNQNGPAGPLESSILELARNKGRFFDNGPRTIINHDDFSVLIKNMPIEDEERYGALKDVLGNLCNAIEARAKGIISQQSNRKRGEIIATVGEALDEIEATFKRIHAANNSAIQDLMEDLEEAMLSLGLSEGQEERIRSISFILLHKSNAIFQESRDLQEQITRIHNILGEALDD